MKVKRKHKGEKNLMSQQNQSSTEVGVFVCVCGLDRRERKSMSVCVGGGGGKDWMKKREERGILSKVKR